MAQPLVVGNWKMNTTRAEAPARWCGRCCPALAPRGRRRSGRVPPFPWLTDVGAPAAGQRRSRSARRTCTPKTGGAYTGEVSPRMLKGLCQYVLVGQYERRIFFAEKDAHRAAQAPGGPAARPEADPVRRRNRGPARRRARPVCRRRAARSEPRGRARSMRGWSSPTTRSGRPWAWSRRRRCTTSARSSATSATTLADASSRRQLSAGPDHLRRLGHPPQHRRNRRRSRPGRRPGRRRRHQRRQLRQPGARLLGVARALNARSTHCLSPRRREGLAAPRGRSGRRSQG